MAVEKENRTYSRVGKIISGGQTGVDRAALDAGWELGILCGGWCPRGRKAEDGPIGTRYPLQETTSSSYSVRTEKNVRESDGTLVLTKPRQASAGTALTIKLAQKHKKPCLVTDPFKENNREKVRVWLKVNRIKVLNVAGPRESEFPGIHDKAFQFLKELFMAPEADQEQQAPPQQT